MCPGPSSLRAIPRSITGRTTSTGDVGVSVAVDDAGDTETAGFELSRSHSLFFHVMADFEGLADWA